MAPEGLSASSGRCFFQRSPQERWVKLALSACAWSCAPSPSSRGASALVQAFPSSELWLQHPALGIPSPGPAGPPLPVQDGCPRTYWVALDHFGEESREAVIGQEAVGASQVQALRCGHHTPGSHHGGRVGNELHVCSRGRGKGL